MAREDTVSQGPSPWPHEHPGQNAQHNQRGCPEAAGEECPAWGSPAALMLPAEQASEGLIIDGDLMNTTMGAVSILLFISGKNRSLKAEVSLQWLGPLAHTKVSAFSKMNPTLS